MTLEHEIALQKWFASMLRRPRLRRVGRSVVQALALPDSVILRLPIDGCFAFDLFGRRVVYHCECGDGLGRALFWRAAVTYERETLDVLELVLREAPPHPTVVDVGANTGLYTLAVLALAPTAQVHAFEPVAEIARGLEHNLGANRLASQVRVEVRAVTERSGPTTIHIPEGSSTSASLGVDGFRGLAGRLEEVAAVALDDYAAERAIERVDLLKIDVEGHEDAVLRGARGLMAHHRPTILCECHAGTDLGAINELIAEHDYRSYHLRAAGPVAVAYVSTDPAERFNNFLLLPAERSRRSWLAGAADPGART